jgi:hypothetical protein
VGIAEPRAEFRETAPIFPAEEPLNCFVWQPSRGDGLGKPNGIFDGSDIGIHATIRSAKERGQLRGGFNRGEGATALSGCYQNNRNISQTHFVTYGRVVDGLKNFAKFSGKLLQAA